MKHDDIVRELEKRLNKIGVKTLKFVEWKKGQQAGEIDLLAIHKDGRYEFYEIKEHDCANKEYKAAMQYVHFIRAHNLKREEFPGYVVFGNFRRISL
jgi:hypothetical protein